MGTLRRRPVLTSVSRCWGSREAGKMCIGMPMVCVGWGRVEWVGVKELGTATRFWALVSLTGFTWKRDLGWCYFF